MNDRHVVDRVKKSSETGVNINFSINPAADLSYLGISQRYAIIPVLFASAVTSSVYRIGSVSEFFWIDHFRLGGYSRVHVNK